MIKAKNFSFEFPKKELYNNIEFTIEDGQHCAFIGSSGNGKSTLVDIILDPDKYMYDGELEINTSRKIGYVSQFSLLDDSSELRVFEFIAEEFLRLQSEIVSICTALETSDNIETDLEKYQQTLDAFEAIGGDDFESVINSQLNLSNLIKQKDLKISELSGGEFKLIQVIKEMLTKPDLMIMDEPDVFLDFENLNSLRKLINNHKGTLLIITHNRYLLDHCFDKILHLEDKDIQEFDGRYVDYNFSLLEKKIELQELAVADDEEIARNAALIDRLRLIATFNTEAARGKSLNARVKIQERLLARRVKAPFVDIKQPNIHFSSENQIEETIAIKLTDYSVAYDETLLEHVNLVIGSNDKVALIGANGTGKTTLFRDIYRNNSESIEIDENIEIAYLSQLQGEVLNETNTVLDEFFESGFKTNTEIKDYLLDYGFEEKNLSQKIESLSGGEKNILQLAKISVSKANMLLLDEPTSHLDIYAQLALEKAIEAYTGAIIMISHDFYSIVNSIDYVLMIEDKNIRRMSMRKFRKMIYANHFDKDYLLIEQKKKTAETKVARALNEKDFVKAKIISEELADIIDELK